MSAMLDRLLDAERLADIARNEAAQGIAPPPVEFDAAFFERSDFAFEIIKAQDCASFGRLSADRATDAELQRDPRGGYAS